MTEPVPYRRRQLVLALVLVLLVALGIGLVKVVRGGGDDAAGPATTVPVPVEKAVDVIDRLRQAPCTLIAPEEVLEASGRKATAIGGGPEGLCTYGLDGTPAGDQVTAQVIGPQSNAQYDDLTVEGAPVPGKPEARWLTGGGPGGRLLAHRGSVTVEVGVRLSEASTPLLQQIGRALLDHAYARIPPNTATSGKTSDGDCSLVATKAIAGVVGEDVEALPQINTQACSFRTGKAFVSVERITGSLPGLDAIKRSTTGADGKPMEWRRTELDLLDGGVYLADPDGSHGGGELYFRKGDVLYHVVVTGVDDPQGAARRTALLLLP